MTIRVLFPTMSFDYQVARLVGEEGEGGGEVPAPMTRHDTCWSFFRGKEGMQHPMSDMDGAKEGFYG